MALTKAAKHVPISLLVAQTLQGEADAALGEAEAMSLRPLATLEELDVWGAGEDQDHEEGQPVL